MRTTVTGLRAWLVQRLSAVYMLFFIVWFLVHFIVEPPHSFPAWREWLMSSGVSIAIAMFFVALMAHVWVGVHDVIMDYVHPVALRVCLLVLLGLSLAAMGGWVMRTLWT